MKRLTEDQVRERLAELYAPEMVDVVMARPVSAFFRLGSVGVRWVEDHYEEVEG